MTCVSALLVAALSLARPSAAATFDLAFVADPDSRFFDFTSDAFAQLDQGYGGDPARDGFFFFAAEGQPFDLGDESDFDAFTPTVFSQITTGSNPNGADVFPQEAAFSDFEDFSDVDFGRLDFDEQSGQITFLRIDWAPFVAPAHSPLNDSRAGGAFGYETVFLDGFGPEDRVTLSNGMVTGIELTTDIRFDYFVDGARVEGFTGEFRIDGARFDLFIDDTALMPTNAGLRTIHNAWDVEGAVLNLAAIAGDYDQDGQVGAADYELWSSTYGQSVAPGVGADGNGDGSIDAADFTVWRDNLIDASGLQAPSPGAWSLGLTATLAWYGVRRRQCVTS